MLTKINNYFYRFEIEKEGEDLQKILDKIYSEIDLPKYRIGIDYPGNQIKTNIIAISKSSQNPIEGEYGVTFQKGVYGIGLNFIDKDYDYTTISGEKDFYGRNSGKAPTELEEIHYYGALKIGLSYDGKYIVGVISIPRVRDGINSQEVSDLLRAIFEKIFGKPGYYKGLNPAYSEGKIIDLFSQSTEINFIKDTSVTDLVGREHQNQVGFPMISIKMKIKGSEETKKMGDYLLSFLGGKTKDEDVKKELSPLRHFSIKTSKGSFRLDSDELKMNNLVEVPDYIYTLPEQDKSCFKVNNLDFIKKNFVNYFYKD